MTWLFLTYTPFIDFIYHYLPIKSTPGIYTKRATTYYIRTRVSPNLVWVSHFYVFSSRARHRFRPEGVFRWGFSIYRLRFWENKSQYTTIKSQYSILKPGYSISKFQYWSTGLHFSISELQYRGTGLQYSIMKLPYSILGLHFSVLELEYWISGLIYPKTV